MVCILRIFKSLKTRLFIPKFYLYVALSLVLIFGCNKKEETVPLNILANPVNNAIHDIHWLGKDIGLICGGKKNQSGFILKTEDGGKTWAKTIDSKLAIYDIHFMNDTLGYACGDSLLLLRTTNKGENWHKITYSFSPEKHNYTPLRCIIGDERFLVVAGGENFDNGNLLWFNYGELRWIWHFDNEFRTGIPFNYSNYWVCGYGTNYQTKNEGYEFSATSFNGDYFTCSCLTTSGAYLCGYNGGIYFSSDQGINWTTQLKPNSLTKKRIHFNGIYVNPSGKGIAVGNNGILYVTHNGKDWEKRNGNIKSNLTTVTGNNSTTFFIGDEHGNIYEITF